MTRPKNLVVAQSGGPTPVINSSLQGIIEAARDAEAIGTVYGARHGIEGVLKEELLDLTAQPRDEVSLVRFATTRLGKDVVDLIDASVAQGYAALSLSVNDGNPARGLYESVGFVYVEKRGSWTMIRHTAQST